VNSFDTNKNVPGGDDSQSSKVSTDNFIFWTNGRADRKTFCRLFIMTDEFGRELGYNRYYHHYLLRESWVIEC